MAVAKNLGMKILIRDEATLITGNRYWGKRLLKKSFFTVLNNLFDGFLAIGSLNWEYYRHYGVSADKIFPMPYAVDNVFFQTGAKKAAAQREQLRRKLRLKTGRPVILFVGKLETRKRPDDLLAACRELLNSGALADSPYLLFVGDGNRRRPLEEAARKMNLDSVRFLGFKNQTELPAFYDLCDVFVLPSAFEPWGLVVNEVMNAGRAVILSDRVGCGPDLVRHGENGFVFPAGDVAALTAVLAKVLTDPAACRAMGEKSRAIISQWGFAEDLAGLRQAIHTVMGQP